MRGRLAGFALLSLAACNALTGVGDLALCEGDCDGDAGTFPERDGAVEASRDASTAADTSVVEDAKPEKDASLGDGAPPLCDANDPSLIVCLPLDGNLTDGSGAPQIGSYLGPAFQPGHIGQALLFAGATGVVFPETKQLDVQVVTLEAFVKPTSYPANVRMMVVDLDGRVSVAVLTSGEVQCRSGGTITTATGITVPLGVFTHVACSVSATELKIYVGGVAAVAQPATTIVPSSTGLGVGVNLPSGEGFIGLLDEVRIWNVVRTPAQIAAAAAR